MLTGVRPTPLTDPKNEPKISRDEGAIPREPKPDSVWARAESPSPQCIRVPFYGFTIVVEYQVLSAEVCGHALDPLTGSS